MTAIDLEAIEARLRQAHHGCDDTWYQCPAHPEGTTNVHYENSTECNCGADDSNAALDELIAEVRRLRRALKYLEWSGTYYQPDGEYTLARCPECCGLGPGQDEWQVNQYAKSEGYGVGHWGPCSFAALGRQGAG